MGERGKLMARVRDVGGVPGLSSAGRASASPHLTREPTKSNRCPPMYPLDPAGWRTVRRPEEWRDTIMIRFLFLTLVVLAAYTAAVVVYPTETGQCASAVLDGGQWVWENVRANPVPVGLAFGTFVLTVAYHKAKGKSLRESVEVAATRVAVIPVAVADADEEHPVVKRARARATRAQLLADQIGLQNRQRKLPDEVLKAEKDACYTEQAVADAERKLADKQKFHEEAVARLELLRKEKSRSEAELAEIDAELRKLAEIV